MKTSSQCDYITGCELPKESGEDAHRAQMGRTCGGEQGAYVGLRKKSLIPADALRKGLQH